MKFYLSGLRNETNEHGVCTVAMAIAKLSASHINWPVHNLTMYT